MPLPAPPTRTTAATKKTPYTHSKAHARGLYGGGRSDPSSAGPWRRAAVGPGLGPAGGADRHGEREEAWREGWVDGLFIYRLKGGRHWRRIVGVNQPANDEFNRHPIQNKQTGWEPRLGQRQPPPGRAVHDRGAGGRGRPRGRGRRAGDGAALGAGAGGGGHARAAAWVQAEHAGAWDFGRDGGRPGGFCAAGGGCGGGGGLGGAGGAGPRGGGGGEGMCGCMCGWPSLWSRSSRG